MIYLTISMTAKARGELFASEESGIALPFEFDEDVLRETPTCNLVATIVRVADELREKEMFQVMVRRAVQRAKSLVGVEEELEPYPPPWIRSRR